MRVRTLFPSTLGLLVLVSGAPASSRSPDAPVVDAPKLERRVRDFVAAANRQDVSAMLAATEPGFRWMSIEGDRTNVEVVGHDQLRSWLEGYFKSTPSAESKLGEIAVDGHYVSAVERVEWRNAEGKIERQSSLSVYQFSDEGRIRDVWYFPAHDEPPR